MGLTMGDAWSCHDKARWEKETPSGNLLGGIPSMDGHVPTWLLKWKQERQFMNRFERK